MPASRSASRFTRRQWFFFGFLLLVAIAVVVLYRTVDLKAWRESATQWNPALVVAALIFLPLLFFPVSVLQVMVGIRFGIAVGMAIVVGSIVIHLFTSFALVRWFRERFERWMRRIRRRIPKGAHRPVTLFTLLLPGAPYAAQNYALPVAGVPLRIYLCYALPLHTARSALAVVLGDQSNRLTPGRIGFMVVYAVILIFTCAWTFRRIRRQLHTAGSPTSAAAGAA